MRNKIYAIFNQQKIFIIGFIIICLSFLCSYNVPFFWDSLSSSELATWFYDHKFSQWVIPTNLNPGHPPLWILLLAFTWTIFGKTLLVSRVLMLLINTGIIYQIQNLINSNKSKKVKWYWYLVLFVEPTFLAQTTIMNNDMLMLFMLLVAFNHIHKNKIIYSLALIGVLFCNLRGMLFFGGFVLYDVLHSFFETKNYKTIIKRLLNYIIPSMVYLSFLWYQFNLLGWVLKKPNGNWEAHRHMVGVKEFVINVLATGWVFADYGRFFFWIFIGFCLLAIFKKKVTIDLKTKNIILLLSCLFVANAGVMVFASNPIGHRYFMPLYLLGLLVFVNLLFNARLSIKKTKSIFFVNIAFLISAHFWIYPETLPQGWDSSLAYLNYFELKHKMKTYILEHHIPTDKIGSKTRNPKYRFEYLKEESQFLYIEDSAISEVDYYVHTNVENGTKDNEIQRLHSDWELVKEFCKKGVFIRLYKSPRAN